MKEAIQAGTLAWRQLRHRGRKVLAALFGTCAAIVLMFMQVGFMNAVYDSARAIPSALAADVVVASREFQTMSYTPPWIPRRVLDEVLGQPGVQAAVPVYALNVAVQAGRHQALTPAWLLGVPAGAVAFNRRDMQEQLASVALPDRFLLDRKSRGGFRDVAGQVAGGGASNFVVPLGAASMHYTGRVSGLFQLGPTFSIDGTLITSDLNFHRVTGQPLDRVSVVAVRVAAGAEPADVAASLRGALGGGVRVMTRTEFLDNERRYFSQETPIGYIFEVGLIVGVVVGIVFILQALHGIISDNLKEYAVLRAMGYRDAFFAWLVGGMALVFLVVAYVPAAALSAVLYGIARDATELPLELKLQDMLAILGAAAAMSAFATVVSLRRLRKADPVDLFA